MQHVTALRLMNAFSMENFLSCRGFIWANCVTSCVVKRIPDRRQGFRVHNSWYCDMVNLGGCCGGATMGCCLAVRVGGRGFSLVFNFISVCLYSVKK